MRASVPVLVAFGSNLGERAGHIEGALHLLRAQLGWRAISGLYATEPMYVTGQPEFLNGVAFGHTELTPYALLDRLKAVELEVGRLPRQRFGPREIDLDLIAYGSLRLRSERLNVPHPRMMERPFVLEPLVELLPHLLWWEMTPFVHEWSRGERPDIRRESDAPIPL